MQMCLQAFSRRPQEYLRRGVAHDWVLKNKHWDFTLKDCVVMNSIQHDGVPFVDNNSPAFLFFNHVTMSLLSQISPHPSWIMAGLRTSQKLHKVALVVILRSCSAWLGFLYRFLSDQKLEEFFPAYLPLDILYRLV